MKHRIIAVTQRDLIRAQMRKDGGKLHAVHIRLVVQRTAVTHDEHLAGVHGFRRLLKNAFLFKLQVHLAFLIVRV